MRDRVYRPASVFVKGSLTANEERIHVELLCHEIRLVVAVLPAAHGDETVVVTIVPMVLIREGLQLLESGVVVDFSALGVVGTSLAEPVLVELHSGLGRRHEAVNAAYHQMLGRCTKK
jgi:hypothetical protein